MGTISLPSSGSRSNLRQQPHEHHGRRNFAAVGAFVEFLEMRLRNRSISASDRTLRVGR